MQDEYCPWCFPHRNVSHNGGQAQVKHVNLDEFARIIARRVPKSKEVGRAGEDAGASYLASCGYDILERNWMCDLGEVDIVARDPQTGLIVLAEVKSRYLHDEQSEVYPELAVNDDKKRRYRKLALMYLTAHPHESCVRFDVIGVNLYASGHALVRYIPDAFNWSD